MCFTRNGHKKPCSFKDDWNPLKLTLDVTMLQKAKLTLVTSLKQLNHDNYFTTLRRSLAESTSTIVVTIFSTIVHLLLHPLHQNLLQEAKLRLHPHQIHVFPKKQTEN